LVNLFEKEGIVKKIVKKNKSEVYLNLDNKSTIWKKRMFNLAQIYDSGIVDFLAEKYSPLSISVIGSYSRGEDIEKSDIDIVIITNKKETMYLAKFEKLLHRRIHLIVAKRKDLSEEFFNNLINGIVLYGALRA
jgi:predicted nucleotidyltransferase